MRGSGVAMKFILVLSIAGTCAATPGAAAIIDYECALKEQGDSGWIADRLILQHDAGRGKLLVVGPVILTMGPDPVAGQLVRTAATRSALAGTSNRRATETARLPPRWFTASPLPKPLAPQ